MHGTAWPPVLMLQPLQSQQGGGREKTKDLRRVTSLTSLARRTRRRSRLGVRHFAAKYSARGAAKEGVTAYITQHNTHGPAQHVLASLKNNLLLSTMASFPSKILLLSISSTPRSGHGDGEGDGEGDGDHGTDTTEKKKKATREIAFALPRRLP